MILSFYFFKLAPIKIFSKSSIRFSVMMRMLYLFRSYLMKFVAFLLIVNLKLIKQCSSEVISYRLDSFRFKMNSFSSSVISIITITSPLLFPFSIFYQNWSCFSMVIDSNTERIIFSEKRIKYLLLRISFLKITTNKIEPSKSATYS